MSHITKDNDSFELLHFQQTFFVTRQTQTQTTNNIFGRDVEPGVDGLCKGCQLAYGDEKKRNGDVQSLNERIGQLQVELGLMRVRNEGLVRQLANNTDSYYEQVINGMQLKIEQLMMQLAKQN